MLPKTVVGLDLFAAHQCLSVQVWPALDARAVVGSVSAADLAVSVLTRTLGTPYPALYLLNERWPLIGQALEDMLGWKPAVQWFGLGDSFEVVGACFFCFALHSLFQLFS